MTSRQCLYPKGDLRRMLLVLAAIEAAPGVTVTKIAVQTALARKTVDDLILQAKEQGAVGIRKDGSGFHLDHWGPVFRAEGARRVLHCALNARTMNRKNHPALTP